MDFLLRRADWNEDGWIEMEDRTSDWIISLEDNRIVSRHVTSSLDEVMSRTME